MRVNRLSQLLWCLAGMVVLGMNVQAMVPEAGLSQRTGPAWHQSQTQTGDVAPKQSPAEKEEEEEEEPDCD